MKNNSIPVEVGYVLREVDEIILLRLEDSSFRLECLEVEIRELENKFILMVYLLRSLFQFHLRVFIEWKNPSFQFYYDFFLNDRKTLPPCQDKQDCYRFYWSCVLEENVDVVRTIKFVTVIIMELVNISSFELYRKRWRG